MRTEEELSKQICDAFFASKNEKEAHENVIVKFGLTKQSVIIDGNKVQWEYCGQNQNNWTNITANSQIAARSIIELLTNAEDAVVERIIKQKNLNPKNMKEVREQCFNVLDGSWVNASREQIESINEIIYIMENTDTKTYGAEPSFSIVDKGCGISNMDMTKTILSDKGSIKLTNPCLHGQHSRGAFGYARFSERSMRGIISKTAPSCQNDNDPFKNDWSFGFNMKFTSQELLDLGFFTQKPKQGALCYLTINGRIPHFHADKFDLNIGDLKSNDKHLSNNQFNSIEHGTLVRVLDLEINRDFQKLAGRGLKNLKDNTKFSSAIKAYVGDVTCPFSGIQPLSKHKGRRNNGLKSYCGLVSHLNLDHSIGKQGSGNHKFFDESIVTLNTPHGQVKSHVYILEDNVAGEDSEGKGFLCGLTGIFWKIGNQFPKVEPKSSLSVGGKDGWMLGILSDYIIAIIDLSNLDNIEEYQDVSREDLSAKDFEKIRKEMQKKILSDPMIERARKHQMAKKIKKDEESKDTSFINELFRHYSDIEKANGKNKTSNASNSCGDNLEGTGCPNPEFAKIKLGNKLTQLHLIKDNFSHIIDGDGNEVQRKDVDMAKTNYRFQLKGDAKLSYYNKYDGVDFSLFVSEPNSEDWIESSFVSLTPNKEGVITVNVVRDTSLDNCEYFNLKLVVQPKHRGANKFEFEFECQNVQLAQYINISPKNKTPKKRLPKQGSDLNGFNLIKIQKKETPSFKSDCRFGKDCDDHGVSMSEDDVIGFSIEGGARQWAINTESSIYLEQKQKLDKALPDHKDYTEDAFVCFLTHRVMIQEKSIQNKLSNSSSVVPVSASNYSQTLSAFANDFIPIYQKIRKI